jgi:TP901 family phage tail tape measure protein
LEDFASNAKKLTEMAAASFVAFRGYIQPVLNSFIEYDNQMRTVAAVTGASAKEMDNLSEKARKLGATTSFSAAQVAEGMTSLGRMGFSSDEIQSSIAAVMDLSRATGTELASAADIAANSLRIFGLSASEMTSVADLLTATANGSAQTVTDLFDALKLVGPTAATAGESITDTCAALGILANLGIKGSLAGTALRNSFLQFANPKIQQALADINVKTTDAEGNLRKMGDIMLDIGVAMANMPSAQRLGFAEDIFGRRGMLAGLNIGADPAKLTAFAARLRDVSKESSRTARDMESGIGGAIDILKSAFTELIIATGDASSAIIKDFAGALSGVFGMVSSVTNAIKGLGDSMSWLGGTVAILGAAGIAAASLHKIITGLAAAFGFLKTAATAAGASVVALTGVCALVTVALAAMIAKALIAQEAVRKLNSEIGGMRRTYDQIKEIQSQYSDDMSAEQRLNLLSREQALLRQNIAEVKALRDADDDRNAHAAYYGDLLSRLQSRLGAVIREERELREVQSSSMAAPDKDRIAELEAKIAGEAEDAETRRLRILEEQTNELKDQYALYQKRADALDEEYERLGREAFVMDHIMDDISLMLQDMDTKDILSGGMHLVDEADNARAEARKIRQRQADILGEKPSAQKEAAAANARIAELQNNLVIQALAPAAKLLADDAARRQEKQEHEALSGMSEKELKAQRKQEAQNEKALQEHYNDIVSGKANPNATASEIAKDASETATKIIKSRGRQDEINARLKDVREAREAAKETTPGSPLGSFSAAFFRYASGTSTDATEKIARDTGSLLDVLKELSRIMKGDSQPAIV